MSSIADISGALKHIAEGETQSPEARSLCDVYSATGEELPRHADRLIKLIQLFRETVSGKGEVIFLRAPGRVNLIGEHTDYNGYPVMPMAIERDILVAMKPVSGTRIRIWNTESKFPPREIPLEFPIKPFEQGDWGNYVKAAVHGLLTEKLVTGDLRGFDAVYSGNIPDSAGLSSSAALVVVSALAFLRANGQTVDTVHLADVLARAERFVGTEGGGMDQAISLLGREHHALKTDFFPLRVKQVPLPDKYRFVVSHSMVRASKSANARNAYNRRVVECRLAAAIGARAIEQKYGTTIRVNRLSDLNAGVMKLEEAEVDDTIHEMLGEDPVSLNEVSSRLGVSKAAILRGYCTLADGSLFAEPPDGYILWKRYRHVVTEARRVEQAVGALESGNMIRFGQLMNDSHTSCRDDYEVSCPELETLVHLGRKYHAVGSRLTGAGFGGCTVNLVSSAHTTKLLDGLKHEFYPLLSDTSQPLSSLLFATRATRGAGALFEVSDR